MGQVDHTSLAFDRLQYEGEAHEVDDGVVEFMKSLCSIETELMEFEGDVSEHRIDTTGWKSTQNLSDLESRHSSYVREVEAARRAVVQGHLTRLDRYDSDDHTVRTQEQAHKFRESFLRMIHRLEQISDRIGRRIDAKRNTANSRLILTVSGFAAIISFTLLLSQGLTLL